MIPAQRNKIDINSLSEEEQKAFRMYGRLPNRKDVVSNKLQERKYFDSGDYALSKAGKAPQQSVGTAIPNPETIPHASSVTSPGLTSSTSGHINTSPTSSFASIGVSTTPIPVPGAGNNAIATGVPGAGSIGNNATPSSGAPGLGSNQAGNTLGASHPEVSAFPTATGASGSPAKENSSLRERVALGEDDMQE